MFLASAELFCCRRLISSDISTAESDCTYRSCSILFSSSANGCSNSRNVLRMGCEILVYQYCTAAESRLRHKNQVATVRHGAQACATSRASNRETGSPLKDRKSTRL